MCVETVRANTGGTNYGFRTIEDREAEGFRLLSRYVVDGRYGSVWMERPCPDCTCSTSEECLTLQDLGTHCATVRGAV